MLKSILQTFLSFLLLVLSVPFLFAQNVPTDYKSTDCDTIVLKSGVVIEAKIVKRLHGIAYFYKCADETKTISQVPQDFIVKMPTKVHYVETAFPHYFGEATLMVIPLYYFYHVKFLFGYQPNEHYGVGLSFANQGVLDYYLQSYSILAGNYILNSKRYALALQLGFVPRINFPSDETRVYFSKPSISVGLSATTYLRNGFCFNIGGSYSKFATIEDCFQNGVATKNVIGYNSVPYLNVSIGYYFPNRFKKTKKNKQKGK
jgi:hypothetical protein